MDTNLKFELLVLDTVEQSVIQSELNLLNSLLSNGLLWKMPFEIIDTAIKSVDEVTLRLEEVEAIQESFAVAENFTNITESELIEELRQQEEYYSKRPNGFVSLSKFVTVHLADKSYSVPSTYRLVKELQAQEKIEVYYVDNPYNEQQKTAAVRIAQATVT